jgi:hypothetical protein
MLEHVDFGHQFRPCRFLVAGSSWEPKRYSASAFH